jgi:hypothetical protein
MHTYTHEHEHRGTLWQAKPQQKEIRKNENVNIQKIPVFRLYADRPQAVQCQGLVLLLLLGLFRVSSRTDFEAFRNFLSRYRSGIVTKTMAGGWWSLQGRHRAKLGVWDRVSENGPYPSFQVPSFYPSSKFQKKGDRAHSTEWALSPFFFSIWVWVPTAPICRQVSVGLFWWQSDRSVHV